jgi:hypothetical protein
MIAAIHNTDPVSRFSFTGPWSPIRYLLKSIAISTQHIGCLVLTEPTIKHHMRACFASSIERRRTTRHRRHPRRPRADGHRTTRTRGRGKFSQQTCRLRGMCAISESPVETQRSCRTHAAELQVSRAPARTSPNETPATGSAIALFPPNTDRGRAPRRVAWTRRRWRASVDRHGQPCCIILESTD